MYKWCISDWSVHDVIQRYVQPLFPFHNEATCWKRLHIRRVIFQDRIWHALLHLITITEFYKHSNAQCSFRVLFCTHYNGIAIPCDTKATRIVVSVAKFIQLWSLFDMLLVVFKVMAMRVTVSVWIKNGKRIKLWDARTHPHNCQFHFFLDFKLFPI